MNNYTNFSRTARMSGTEYACAIERTRRHDAPGRLIVAVLVAVIAFVWVMS